MSGCVDCVGGVMCQTHLDEYAARYLDQPAPVVEAKPVEPVEPVPSIIQPPEPRPIPDDIRELLDRTRTEMAARRAGKRSNPRSA